MDQSKAIALTNTLLGEFYNFGSIINLLAVMEDQIIGFGAQSLQYVQGKDKMDAFLRKEHQMVAPCKIVKLSFHEEKSSDGCTVLVNGILRTGKAMPLVMHRLLFMYREQKGTLRLSGLHITRDLHHEATYRMIRSHMLNRGMKENKSMEVQSADIISSYVDCAYVVYERNEGHSLLTYSDELWKMLGYVSAQEFQNVTADEMWSVIHEEDHARLRGELTRQLVRKGSYQLEYRMCCKDGSLLWIMECGRRVLDQLGKATYSSLLTNITPLKRTSENLLYRVSYDALTGIYNKTAFYQKAQEIIGENPEMSFEIMRIDIERFKVINDLFGEETGDRLLKYIARFFKHVNLPFCVYGRLHSDNFLLLYPVGNDNRQRFITSLQTMAASFSLDYRIVLCFGVYAIQDRRLSMSAMCDRASMALNKAKLNGLMVCGEYDEHMRQRIVDEQAIVNDMNDALERREFILYMQPKYELTTEKVIGAEALVRWVHPVRGFVSPAEFIPVFEQNGFIFKLDRYVWEEACRFLRKALDAGRNPMPISVNVSRVDLYNTNIVRIFDKLVQKYEIPPRLLELELTESAYMDNPQQIIEIAKELQSLGFKILMDDFGSGYSSLNMLKDMPVDILKIDLKFLDSTDKSDRGGNILNSVVRMAKWLRIPVIAEGVETRQQADFLRTIGCNYVQGYYYSRPIPLQDYEELIEHEEYHPDSTVMELDAEDLEDLLNPNAQFNLLFNSVNGGIGLYELTDSGLELLRANDGYFELFGSDRESVYEQGRRVIDAVHPEDRAIFMEAIEGTKEYGKIAQCRIRRFCQDGRMLWLHIRVSLVSREEARHLLYLAIEDVTELQTKTMELQALFDHIPGGFGVYELRNGEIRTLFFSRWLYEINGLDRDTFMQRDGGALDVILDHDTIEVLKAEIIRAYEENRTVHLEYPFVTAEGDAINIRVAFNTVKENGAYLCYAFLRDVDMTVEPGKFR